MTQPCRTSAFDTLSPEGVGVGGGDGRVTVTSDRIPSGECEIRHESRVVSSDEHGVAGVVKWLDCSLRSMFGRS